MTDFHLVNLKTKSWDQGSCEGKASNSPLQAGVEHFSKQVGNWHPQGGFSCAAALCFWRSRAQLLPWKRKSRACDQSKQGGTE